MDLFKLKSLIAVSELNSITAASKAVNLSQSAVSQQLKELERELDLKLLDRTRRPVCLTTAGAELVGVARNIITLWDDFQDRYQKKEYSGRLVLGYVRSAITDILAQAILLLRDQYPEMNIQLVNTGGVSKHLSEMVADHKIDVSMGIGPLPMPKGVLWRPIALERYYVVAPAHYKGNTDEKLLLQGPYLRFKPFSLNETIIDRGMKRRGLHLETGMELDDYASILLMVRHGLGVGIVPEPNIDLNVSGEFRCLPFCTPQLTREGGLMVRFDNPNMNLVVLLWKTLKHLHNKKHFPF